MNSSVPSPVGNGSLTPGSMPPWSRHSSAPKSGVAGSASARRPYSSDTRCGRSLARPLASLATNKSTVCWAVSPSASRMLSTEISDHTVSLSLMLTSSGAPNCTPPLPCSAPDEADNSTLNCSGASGRRSSAAATVTVLLVSLPLKTKLPPALVAVFRSAATVLTCTMSQNTVTLEDKSGPVRVTVKDSPSASFSSSAAPPLTGAKKTACAARGLPGICTSDARIAAAPSATWPAPAPADGAPSVTVRVSAASAAPSSKMAMPRAALVSPAAMLILPPPASV